MGKYSELLGIPLIFYSITSFVALFFWISTPMGAPRETWETIRIIKTFGIIAMYLIATVLSLASIHEYKRSIKEKQE